ncbi:hypothetical protein POX_d04872 [Penicillium oxalicum]|uniref:Major facilitator superfamily (MFS) profile domain-containing protein n=1 Tax=Penicillium oxalicum (strain 114-2 / CGMCC 5302) TaxID=933388 RepID=S7ZRD4_PENO1|nr:hypothetical protein POX_d04872 [Penicillium oxalicum]EPS32979.1 hypothetical protein PDE_07940 [Penicillium oxalicum 114-2]KAI2789384.1 hypothetical protein POX_d04872 [Penicillium oxalicum]
MEKRQAPSAGGAAELAETKIQSTLVARDVDIGQILETHATPEMERKVLLKLDLYLIPLMGFCYMLQYMDKLALSQATLFNLTEDLNLKGKEYNWASAIFYFGYFAWSWPSSYLIVRLPLGKYLGAAVFVWGGVLMCHAACTSFSTLMAARFFLGVGEASIAPGFAMITGMFYKREEQPARQAAWFVGNSIATVIGGLVAYGIGLIQNPIVNSWQLLFLVLGAVTSGYGVILLFLLPDSPTQAVFLTKTERSVAIQRTLQNKTGVMDTGKFRWNQVFLAMKDPQTWFLVLYTFCVNLCNGGITSFASIIIAGFGFSNLKALLIQMPLGAAQLVFLILTSGIATLFHNTRILMMILNTVTSMIGMVLIWKLESDDRAGRMAGLCLGAVFAANIPLSLSLISSNVAGFTKKSTVSALMFVAYCVGNIVGPQFFVPAEKPSYSTGIKASMAGLVLGVFFLTCLYVFYVWENRRRDRLYGTPEHFTETEELQDELSNKTDQEIESFRYVL